MSLKTKRHRKSRNEEETMEADLSRNADSSWSSIRETASSNKRLLGMIAAGAGLAGAAVYGLRTERGQALQGRMGETIRDSSQRIRNLSTTGLNRLRSLFKDDVDTRSGDLEFNSVESESYRPIGLRRIV
jgi:hypothetical protein